MYFFQAIEKEEEEAEMEMNRSRRRGNTSEQVKKRTAEQQDEVRNIYLYVRHTPHFLFYS